MVASHKKIQMFLPVQPFSIFSNTQAWKSYFSLEYCGVEGVKGLNYAPYFSPIYTHSSTTAFIGLEPVCWPHQAPVEYLV